jgi:hypothetical protein
MLDLQHQYNNCTTIPHMRVGPTYWGPPSCEGLLYSCCIGVVQESNPFLERSLDMINYSYWIVSVNHGFCFVYRSAFYFFPLNRHSNFRNRN